MNSPQTHLAFLTFKNLHTFPLTQPSHALQQLIQRSRRFSSSHLFSTSTKTLSKNSKPIRVMEVSPRDGLQNESKILPLELKLDLIQSLLAIKLTSIEVGSFVSPKWVRPSPYQYHFFFEKRLRMLKKLPVRPRYSRYHKWHQQLN